MLAGRWRSAIAASMPEQSALFRLGEVRREGSPVASTRRGFASLSLAARFSRVGFACPRAVRGRITVLCASIAGGGTQTCCEARADGNGNLRTARTSHSSRNFTSSGLLVSVDLTKRRILSVPSDRPTSDRAPLPAEPASQCRCGAARLAPRCNVTSRASYQAARD